MDNELINDVREAFEGHNPGEDKVTFELVSLIGMAFQPELKLASSMTLGLSNESNSQDI